MQVGLARDPDRRTIPLHDQCSVGPAPVRCSPGHGNHVAGDSNEAGLRPPERRQAIASGDRIPDERPA